ncbi:MAG: 3-hydroxyacyl-CoA dehydrogenase NAD-binding domain-containing protein [Bacteroidota bacterium]
MAVLGSGIMGSRIACHFANTGLNVLLLDIVPKELTEEEKKKGLTPESKAFRNRIVNDALQTAVKSNPSPLYIKSSASLITTGNFDDNMKDIASCDWVLEAVVENIDIKKKVFEQVERFRKPGTLITSNTSGIPIASMLENRSDDFVKHFCGTHFFNPPRYLALLEIIPTPQTLPEVIDFFTFYGDRYLGKTTVPCNDTPAFIANRIGVFGIQSMFHLVEQMGLSVEAVDKLTGPVIGRPKSATFRTCDVVGLDTLAHVANGLYINCVNDSKRELFKLPGYVQQMLDNKWLGDKTKQGFYKKTKVKAADGSSKTEILALNLKTLEYEPQSKVKFATLELTKTIDSLEQRLPILVSGKDVAGDFYRASFYGLFQYVADRIPEITPQLNRIDDAMKAGFGWELGPFEMWDILGVEKSIAAMEGMNLPVADWVKKMIASGNTSFYKVINGKNNFYDINSNAYQKITSEENFIILKNERNKTVWKNNGCSVIDIGDGVLCLEFQTKMNTIGGEIVQGVSKVIELAEKDFRGVVIGNDGANFSAGANLGMVFMMAVEQDFDEIDMAIRAFQGMNMRVRYSSVPVVVAPHGLSLGGGCEMALHADHVQAAAESYVGLVEFGVGLIPGGGGTKEFALRLSDDFKEGDIEVNNFRERFLTIATAKVSTSAQEAMNMGILKPDRDKITLNRRRLIADAKAAVIELADSGYTMPAARKNIKVLGRNALGIVYAGANTMFSGHYMTEYDKFISEKLGYVMCGGDLSAATLVSEQYLLDLEREVFLSLCGEKKTLERIQSILTSGKPLRN